MPFRARFQRFSLTPAHYVFAAVVAVRIFVLSRLASSPFLLPSRGDMHFYNDWAMRIMGGDWSEPHAFYGLPGYAYLLAVIYKLTTYSPFIPASLQALLDGGTAVILYKLAGRMFEKPVSQWIGIAAATGWALFVPAQAYSAVLMPTVWLVFVFWLLVWEVSTIDKYWSLVGTAILGLLIGLMATVVATILFLIPLVVAAILCRRFNGSLKRRLAMILLLFLGIIAGTSPCWVHNYFVARDPVFLSAHSGINFWIGNNPTANGYPRFPPGLRAGQAAMLQDSIDVAETAAGHPLKRAEVSRYWSAQANAYIRAHFGDWLRLLAHKLRNFWSAFQYDDLSIVTILREEGVLLPGLYFGVVAALGLPGMFIAWRKLPASRWVTAAIALHMCSLMTVFTTERYRLAVIPGLLLFAAYFVVLCWRAFASVEWRSGAVYLALLAAATTCVAWPQRDASLWALDAYNSGWQALEAHNFPLAEKKLAIARAYVPTNPETNFALGNLRLEEGNSDSAAEFYRATLQFDPQHGGAMNNLAVLALNQHRLGEAEQWLERAIKRDPRNAKAHFILAKTLFEAGNRDGARLEVDRAIALRPEQPEFREFRNAFKQ